MIESEARKKWCPILAKLGGTSTTVTTVDGKSTTLVELDGFKCIASDCMAWRTYHEKVMDGPHSAMELHGYCGLAGKP